MPESPHPKILNREQAQEHANEHFADQLALLRDLANYGSNLVVRAFGSSPKKLEDVVVCGVLLKQIVAMLDAVEVLLSAGIAQASYLPARAAFEASLYMDWMLLENTERKAKCYIVSNFREERKWASRAIKGTKEEAAFRSLTDELGVDIHAEQPNLIAEATKHLSEIERVLAQADLASIDAEFEQKRRGKRRSDLEWYVLAGASSIRKVAQDVNRLTEYEFLYGRGSHVTHTATYKDHVQFRSGQVRFRQVRHVAEFRELLNLIVIVAFSSYQKVLAFYRPAELPAFAARYLSDWREPFRNVKNVTYSA